MFYKDLILHNKLLMNLLFFSNENPSYYSIYHSICLVYLLEII